MFNPSNIFHFIGRLTADIKLEKLPNGRSIAKFSIGVARTKEITDFIRITTFGQSADFLNQYARKGDLINIAGHVEARSWEDQTGTRRFSEDHIADEVQILSHSQKNSRANDNLYTENENSWQNASNQATEVETAEYMNPFGLDDSDLPF